MLVDCIARARNYLQFKFQRYISVICFKKRCLIPKMVFCKKIFFKISRLSYKLVRTNTCINFCIMTNQSNVLLSSLSYFDWTGIPVFCRSFFCLFRVSLCSFLPKVMSSRKSRENQLRTTKHISRSCAALN